MSNQRTPSLLDDILTDADQSFAEAQAEERAKVQPSRARGGAFNDVEELATIDDVALCKVLAAAQRDDLLTVLSSASDGLRRRVLVNLSPESARWIEQNLAYFGAPTRALLATGRGRVLAIANELVAGAAIEAPPRDGDGEPTVAVHGELEALLAVVTELLALVQKRGHAGLRDVVQAGGDVMLNEALGLVARGVDEQKLAAVMDAMRAELMAAYERRLAVTREAALALLRAEDPDAFRRRVAPLAK